MLARERDKKSKAENCKSELDVLWTALRQGDKNSLSDLFRQSYPWLFNYGYKIVPNEAFIKDAIQDLFLRLWEKRASINEANSVRAYLFSSLRRIIFRRLKKKEHRMERNHRYQKNMFEKVYNVEELMIHVETDRARKNKAELALESLSKRQKEAIYLKFYDGLSNNEIAEVMNINVQSVYNHISEAIHEMQALVGNSHENTKEFYKKYLSDSVALYYSDGWRILRAQLLRNHKE
jgi:RNA polymerase sigma-70 factor (ECF subfamily)